MFRSLTHFCWLAVLCLPAGARAQLRPLEPLDWTGFSATHSVRAALRLGWYADQRASLAGVVGDLFEVGDVRVGFRSGRVLLEVGGTPQRFLRNEEVLEPPAGDAQASTPSRGRHDSGDYRLGTAIAIGDVHSAGYAVVRFGTRLPTTDNRVGLDRDATDFFGLVGWHQRWGMLRLGAEAGVSINGTRITDYEQSDVLAYDVTIEYTGRKLRPSLTLVGQNDLRSGRIRGNEDLMELRGSIQAGATHWFDAGLVLGLADFSPTFGVVAGAGMQIGGPR